MTAVAERILLDCKQGKAAPVQKALDLLYKQWASVAEKELLGTRQTSLPCLGPRGKPPQMHWVSILSQDKQAPHRQPELFFDKMAGK